MRRGLIVSLLSILLVATTMSQASAWREISSGQVIVRYPPGHEEGAQWVLQEAVASIPKVAEITGLKVPRTPVVIEVYPTFHALAREVRTNVLPNGVFNRKTDLIKIVDPSTYTADYAEFRSIGVVPHEMSHWLLHHVTGDGQYPSWFDEGLAEIVESLATQQLPSQRCPRLDEAALARGSAFFDQSLFSEAYEAAHCLVSHLDTHYRDHDESPGESEFAAVASALPVQWACRVYRACIPPSDAVVREQERLRHLTWELASGTPFEDAACKVYDLCEQDLRTFVSETLTDPSAADTARDAGAGPASLRNHVDTAGRR